jgi:rhamnose transport system ATP-binding protein
MEIVSMPQSILEMQSVSKHFGATAALRDFSLEILSGEIHALVGENGAGKSTLIKTMTGIYLPSSGKIWMDGQPQVFRSTQDAQALGVAAIYQEPMVFPDLDIAENIFINHHSRSQLISWGSMYKEAKAIIAKLGVSLDVRRAAASLTLAEQQTVEIARAISLDVRVLIMDEPSASLSDNEVQKLFSIARSLRTQGVAILYISHRLEEVFALADRVTVVRDGALISTKPIADVTNNSVVTEMVGRDMQGRFARVASKAKANDMLSVERLSKDGIFADVSFNVKKGEIVCLSGLVGARRTDVALSLFGIAPSDSGKIKIDGDLVKIKSPKQALDLGIAYVSEDRRKLGIAMDETITSNITLPKLDHYCNALGLIDIIAEEKDAQIFRDKLDIKAVNLQTIVGNLSGGNQQKVMLAKWLNTSPRLLIVDEPTRGIDVGAKAEVHHILRELASEGVAILIVSSDLPEVLSLADRIIVMREGRLAGEFIGALATEENVMQLAVGASTQSEVA